MDEVAGRFGLSGGVALEVSVDRVLQLPAERLRQQLGEVLQPVGVVGQAELAGEKNAESRDLTVHHKVCH